jgi:hypothetical protein
MTKRWSREARTLGTALRSTPAWTARGGSRRPPSAPGRPPRRRRGCPPDQPVVAGQQLLQLPRPDAAGCRHRTPSERPSRRPPPGSSAPGAGLAPMPTVPAQQPDRAPKGCGGTGRERPASRGNDQAKQTGQAADLALWSPRRDSNPRPSDYEAKRVRPAGTGQCCSRCSRWWTRPCSVALNLGRTAGEMTAGMASLPRARSSSQRRPFDRSQKVSPHDARNSGPVDRAAPPRTTKGGCYARAKRAKTGCVMWTNSKGHVGSTTSWSAASCCSPSLGCSTMARA